MLIQPLDGGAISCPLQPQSFEKAVGKGAVLQFVDLVGPLVGAAGRYRDDAGLRFAAHALAVAGPFVAAGVEQQDHVFGAAAAKPLGDVADRDRRLLDIAGVRVARHQIVAVSFPPAMAGKEEPEIVARLQEFLFESDPQEPA